MGTSFGLLLRKGAVLYGDRCAVAADGQQLTYGELYERSCGLASVLCGLGLEKGDRVATLADNMLESVEEIGALTLAGLVRCPLYTGNSIDIHIELLNLVGARALLIQDRYWWELAPRLHQAPTVEHVVVHHAQDGALDYDELLAQAPPADPNVPVENEDVHIIRFSGGTTGRPKAIAHTVRAWREGLSDWFLAVPRLDDRDRYLVAGPLSHASGIVVWPPLAHGVRLVVMAAFDAGDFLRLVEEERCTFSVLSPTQIRALIAHPEAKRRDLSSLRFLLYGSEPIAETTLAKAQQLWGNIMYQFYGQSEALVATILPPRDHVLDGTDTDRRRLRSAGRPIANAHVRILDEDGHELGPGAVGGITLLTPALMKELWNEPEATAERFTADGWLRTGDLGYLDDDGFLYVTDRREDVISKGGRTIWPSEVENVLYAHPEVLEAAVVAGPDGKGGETPVAVVVLKDGGSASKAELIDWCRERVGSAKAPTSIELRPEPLPRSPVGKVVRQPIRDALRDGAASAGADPRC